MGINLTYFELMVVLNLSIILLESNAARIFHTSGITRQISFFFALILKKTFFDFVLFF